MTTNAQYHFEQYLTRTTEFYHPQVHTQLEESGISPEDVEYVMGVYATIRASRTAADFEGKPYSVVAEELDAELVAADTHVKELFGL